MCPQHSLSQPLLLGNQHHGAAPNQVGPRIDEPSLAFQRMYPPGILFSAKGSHALFTSLSVIVEAESSDLESQRAKQWEACRNGWRHCGDEIDGEEDRH